MVQDDPADAGIAPVLKVLHCARDVVCCIERHFFTGSDYEHVFSISFPYRCRKPAADDIPQDIIQNHIRFPGLEQLQILQKLESSDNAASGTAQTGSRTAGLDAQDTPEPDLCDLLDRLRLLILFAQIIHHRPQRSAAQQVDRRVRLGIASDLDHPFSQRGKSCRQMTGHGGFTDAALAVNGYFKHEKSSFPRFTHRRSPKSRFNPWLCSSANTY